MKKTSAATGRAPLAQSIPEGSSLPPPFSGLDTIEAVAASEIPSLEGSWWISHQVSEHIFSIVTRRDPRTGDSLPQSLIDLLEGLSTISNIGLRPFPHDRLFVAAQFSSEPMARLLDHHRHRIIRTHEQLPFHSIREVDARSLTWLARQPGRNIR